MFRSRNGSHSKTVDPGQSDLKVNELREALGPLSRRSSQYCTDACLRRYLVARNGNLDKAKKMLEETLQWRAAFKPDDISWNDIATEGETGKLFRANFHDRYGRTVLIMRPGKENTKNVDNQIKFLVYNLENAIFNLPEDQEQMVWLIDFTGWSPSGIPVKVARETVHVLQNHYPERLAMGFLYNPPRIFEAFFKVIKYFMDPKTIQKVKFVYMKDKDSVEVMKTYFDDENLPAEFGGKATLSYDHKEFSKLMAQDDAKRAADWGLKTDEANRSF